MNDTPPEMERKYREMLLRRSGAERLKMGCSMFATARAFVLASVLEREPSLSTAALRRALFLRLYGSEFDADKRERIAARLCRDDPPPHRPPRKVPVDWGDLEMALTADPGQWSCYLDVRSGEVQMVPVDRFGGGDDWPSEEELDAELEAGHLIPIEPLGPSVEYGWMAEFTGTVGAARLRDRLEVALEGRGAFRRFKDVLGGHPAERERWFAFRDERLRAVARRWLAEQGIEATTEAPREQRGSDPPGAV
jgi:hypothetical protein